MNVDIDPWLRKRFHEICKREGETMSKKIRRWITQYVVKHEKGNPQLCIDNLEMKPHPLLTELLKEDKDFITPTVEGRRKRLEILEMNLKRFPRQPTLVAIAFMKKTGLKARTVEGYMRVLGRPVQLRPKRAKRNY